MYSGSTLHRHSGQILGAHQKIDRVARRHLARVAPGINFPTARAILRFEGNNGPDGIKRKSPAQNEPWHYIQPFNLADTQLLDLIEDDHAKLVAALRSGDQVRAAFHAAWLAHAVVDGLTPAHHFPYEEELTQLYDGSIAERTTIAKKIILPGPTVKKQLQNNWKMWGPKGLFTTHAAFEDGFAVLLAPLRLTKALPSADDIAAFQALPLRDWYRQQAQAVASMELYSQFIAKGWTTRLANQARRRLAPMLVQTVTLTWYGACLEAGVAESAKAHEMALV